jgi:hypothetical protein
MNATHLDDPRHDVCARQVHLIRVHGKELNDLTDSVDEALGVSTTRAPARMRKGGRLISDNKVGAPATERPADSPGPLAADHNHEEHAAWIIPPTT